jgi:hypothetical protein
MSKKGRPRNTNGCVFQRGDSLRSWLRYRDKKGRIIRESTGIVDREEADRMLRERLTARDEGTLSSLLSGKALSFDAWADWFLENRSKPPIRAEATHRGNLEVLRQLRPVFGKLPLSEISAELIEEYLAGRLRSRRRIRTKLGTYEKDILKPSTVHREYRVLNRILNVAVQKKRLAVNPCQSVEFPARLAGTTRKPHYLTAREQALVEFFAPSYLKNVVVIMVEMGFAPIASFCPCARTKSIWRTGWFTCRTRRHRAASPTCP